MGLNMDMILRIMIYDDIWVYEYGYDYMNMDMDLNNVYNIYIYLGKL